MNPSKACTYDYLLLLLLGTPLVPIIYFLDSVQYSSDLYMYLLVEGCPYDAKLNYLITFIRNFTYVNNVNNVNIMIDNKYDV